jgi:hypothetical protein
LRKYGRPVTNDEYVAMGYGPVGSKTKDIAEDTSFLDIKDLFVMDTDDKEEMLKYVKEQMELKNQWEQIPD